MTVVSIEGDERTVYIKLSQTGQVRLRQYYQDSRRRSPSGSSQRSADLHRVHSMREPTEWWLFTFDEFMTIFSGMTPADVRVNKTIQLTTPLEVMD